MNVICLTSNNYVQMIRPFAYLFNKYWSAEQPVTILRYDIRVPRGIGANFHQTAIGVQENYTWSSGLASWLRYAGPDMFILLLEDYWLSEPVKIEAVQTAWDYMLATSDIGKIDISGDLLNREHFFYTTVSRTNFVIAGSNTQFQTSIQAAIWRKDFILTWLNNSESAWQFEKAGTRRIISARKKNKCSDLILGVKPGAVSYINACGGEGNLPGMYDHRKIPGWMWQELLSEGLVQ